MSSWLTPQVYEILTHGVHQDLSFYEELHRLHPGPILDIGAGLGRISVPLMTAEQSVVLLEHNPYMCSELCQRLSTLPDEIQQKVSVLEQDITAFEHLDESAIRFGSSDTLPEKFSLIILGLRTIHLFNETDRHHILSFAKRHLQPGGALAIHYSDLESAPSQPSWKLVVEHPLEEGTIEVDECFYLHSPSQQYHLRHRIWQSNVVGQHIGSWRVAHNLYAIDIQDMLIQLSGIGFQDIQAPSFHDTESFIVAKV